MVEKYEIANQAKFNAHTKDIKDLIKNRTLIMKH